MSSETRSPREQANLALAKRFYAAIFSGDWVTVAACVGPDFAVVEAEGLPYGGTWKGIDGFRELFTQLSVRYYDQLQIQEKALTANDDCTMSHFRLSAIAKPTGNRVETDILEILEIRDGLVSCLRPFYWDTRAVARAFGVA